MRYTVKRTLLFLIISFCLLFGTYGNLLGQGCSDAGFCTIDGLKPHGLYDASFKTKIKVGVNFGGADHNITVFGNYLELNQQLGKKAGFDLKLTSLSQTGNSISAFGFSDAFINFKYRVNERLNLTAGAKIPLSNGGKTKSNLALPMDYQSSLGTVDFIVGIGSTIKKLQWVLGLQQPVKQNANEFLSELYPANSALRDFQSTNGFTRKGDALFRLSYPIEKNKFRFTPSLLPIYHLGNDEYVGSGGNMLEIEGSEGLTLNANLYFDYLIGEKAAIQLSAGSPLIVREARPDGLTRSFILNIEYSIKF